jgi:hypothetical protein
MFISLFMTTDERSYKDVTTIRHENPKTFVLISANTNFILLTYFSPSFMAITKVAWYYKIICMFNLKYFRDSLFLDLFVYVLFNDIFSSSENRALNGMIINE